MSVEIKLAFDTAEEAIVALGKLVGIKGRKNPVVTAPEPFVPSVAPLIAIVEPTPPVAPARRPGRPRKATSEPGQGATPLVVSAPTAPAEPVPAAPTAAGGPALATTAVPATVAGGGAVAPGPALPAAAVPTPEQVQAAVEKMFNAKDFDATLALLQRFGVKRGADLLPVQRADFINRVAGVLERGEAI